MDVYNQSRGINMANPNPLRNLPAETDDLLGKPVSVRLPVRLMDRFEGIPNRSEWVRRLIVEALERLERLESKPNKSESDLRREKMQNLNGLF
jgi:hypothetical protein